MSAFLSSVPKLQFFDANGDPLVGGKLYTYAAGTTTPLATYTDSTGATPNTNPIILDSRGEANVWLTAASYKFELKTSADALIWTVDNISNALNLSQLLANSGSAANPPYTFAADPDTGMYLQAVGQLGLSANGTPVMRATSTTMIIGQSGGLNDVDTTVYGDVSVNGLLEVVSSADPSQAFYRPTNTPSASIGRVTWEGFNASAVRSSYARIQGEITANTTGAHTGSLNFYTATSGAITEKVRIDAVGRVGIGTNAPTTNLHVQATDLVNSSVTSVLRLDHQTSGSPSSGIGVGAEFAVETASGNTEVGAAIEAIATSVTAGSENFALVFKTMSAGATAAERVRITDAGNVGIGLGGGAPNTRLTVAGTGSSVELYQNTPSIRFASTPNRTNSWYVGANINDSLNSGFVIGVGENISTPNSSQVVITSAGLLQFNSGYGSVAPAYGCRAWINFNGTGTPAARASGNVSSITDNGTGDYTINFSSAMPDVNYAVVGTAMLTNEIIVTTPGTIAYNTGSIRIGTRGGAGALADPTYVNLAIFR